MEAEFFALAETEGIADIEELNEWEQFPAAVICAVGERPIRWYACYGALIPRRSSFG